MTVVSDPEPMTLERAADLARRGFQPIETYLYEPMPGEPGCQRIVRRRTPREVLADLHAVLGEYPVGGEEGLHVVPSLNYECATCPTRNGHPMCSKYEDHYELAHFKRGGCRLHTTCKQFTPCSEAPMPDGTLVVFSVRGSSEGDYTHVEVLKGDGTRELILLAKTFQGRDASWTFARHVADLLGA
jgi:hypothetical protein